MGRYNDFCWRRPLMPWRQPEALLPPLPPQGSFEIIGHDALDSVCHVVLHEVTDRHRLPYARRRIVSSCILAPIYQLAERIDYLRLSGDGMCRSMLPYVAGEFMQGKYRDRARVDRQTRRRMGENDQRFEPDTNTACTKVGCQGTHGAAYL